MDGPIVKTQRGITLVGGGDLDPRDLSLALSHAPVLVAADGGADAAIRAGHLPHAVIGDLDSLSDAARRALPADRVHLIEDQACTDFQKCLGAVAAPLVLGVGFLGARIDHELAAFSALAAHRSGAVVLLGADDLCFHAPPKLSLDLAMDSRLSIFPMGPVRGRSCGLFWPIDGLALAPLGPIATSNRVNGPVTLWFDGPGALVILPRGALAQVLAALNPG